MTKKELREYIKKQMGDTFRIAVCPICSRVDVWPGHEEECDPADEARREENLEHY